MSSNKPLPRFLTLQEVSKLTSRSRRSLYLDIALGKLKRVKFGGSVRIAEADFLAYVAAAAKGE